jgi:two-component system LytT family sensor kinase
VEAKEHELIVPMTLQLLVENCVKHNEISAAQPLRIQIVRNGGYLTVENNLQPKAAGEHSKKTGLSNIKQQYSYFTDQELIVSESGEKFSVKVPVIKMEQA